LFRKHYIVYTSLRVSRYLRSKLPADSRQTSFVPLSKSVPVLLSRCFYLISVKASFTEHQVQHCSSSSSSSSSSSGSSSSNSSSSSSLLISLCLGFMWLCGSVLADIERNISVLLLKADSRLRANCCNVTAVADTFHFISKTRLPVVAIFYVKTSNCCFSDVK